MDEERTEDEERQSDEERKSGNDSPGPDEPTEAEQEEQRAKDARKARERLDEVRDAPPEEHGALKADAAGSTVVLIGVLFIVIGLYVALAVSPWGWAAVAFGITDVIVGQIIRRGTFGRGG